MDSWEGRQEELFLFSWGGPDPRNTVKHVWWGVSHNDFFGKGESSRNKNNTDPTFCQSGGRGWGSWCRIILLLSWCPGSHLTPKKLPCAWQPVAVKETEDRSRRSGQACWEQLVARRGSPSCTAPGAVGASLVSPSLEAWCKLSPSTGHWDPRKAKPTEDLVPVQLASSGQKQPFSEDVTWAVDPKRKWERWSLLYKVLFRGLEGQDFASGLLY